MKNNSLCLTDYLSVGADNGITAKQLARLLGWNDRDVTHAVHALRKKGVLICSDTLHGFWLPTDDSDVKNFICQMNGRITEMQKATQPAVEYLENGGGDIDRE